MVISKNNVPTRLIEGVTAKLVSWNTVLVVALLITMIKSPFGSNVPVAPVATVLMEVTLSAHRQVDFERFEQAIKEVPEVVACWSVGGGVDYMLKIVARDIEGYQRLVDDLLARQLGIDRHFTYIVIKTVKDEGALPLERLVPEDIGA